MTAAAAVVAAARAWIGTPYVTGASLRGAGADCIGLVEGVQAELTGAPNPERPPWRADWAHVTDLAAVATASGFRVLDDPAAAAPGDVLALDLGEGVPHHLAILSGSSTILHAWRGRGVIESRLAGMARRTILAARFPNVE